MDFIVFILSSIGITFIVIHSYLLKPFRTFVNSKSKKLGKLVSCPMCFGTYVGWLVQFIILFHNREPFFLHLRDVYYILYGFASSFVCYASYMLLKSYMDKFD